MQMPTIIPMKIDANVRRIAVNVAFKSSGKLLNRKRKLFINSAIFLAFQIIKIINQA